MSRVVALRVTVNALLQHRLAKPAVFGLSGLPCIWLVYAAFANELGANPAETLVRATGDWTLRFLCAVLGVTPLRVITGVAALARFRRMLGLFVYFYSVTHLLSYSWFDMGFDLAEIARDIAKRPFILVGFTSLLVLSALAATSFNGAVKALGAQRWRNLHKLVFLVAMLAILHFFWMRAGKNDFAEVAVYAGVLGSLLVWRVIWFALRRRR